MAKLFIDKEKKIVNPDLFTTEAHVYMDNFCQDIPTKSGRLPIKSTQLRRFYNEVLVLKAKAESADDFSYILPYIKMIIPKSFYARTRGHVGENFIRFIGEYIKPLTADDQKDFFLFCDLFEAIIAYYPKDSKEATKS